MDLFRPLSPAALQCFEAGSGNELADVGERPAKMRALHSSSALVVNFFDRWIDQPGVVLEALDAPTGGVSMRFESQFPTGLHGTPPNLDAAIKWADGTWLGTQSKFTEGLTQASERVLYAVGAILLPSCARSYLKLRPHQGDGRCPKADVDQLSQRAASTDSSGSRMPASLRRSYNADLKSIGSRMLKTQSLSSSDAAKNGRGWLVTAPPSPRILVA